MDSAAHLQVPQYHARNLTGTLRPRPRSQRIIVFERNGAEVTYCFNGLSAQVRKSAPVKIKTSSSTLWHTRFVVLFWHPHRAAIHVAIYNDHATFTQQQSPPLNTIHITSMAQITTTDKKSGIIFSDKIRYIVRFTPNSPKSQELAAYEERSLTEPFDVEFGTSEERQQWLDVFEKLFDSSMITHHQDGEEYDMKPRNSLYVDSMRMGASSAPAVLRPQQQLSERDMLLKTIQNILPGKALMGELAIKKVASGRRGTETPVSEARQASTGEFASTEPATPSSTMQSPTASRPTPRLAPAQPVSASPSVTVRRSVSLSRPTSSYSTGTSAPPTSLKDPSATVLMPMMESSPLMARAANKVPAATTEEPISDIGTPMVTLKRSVSLSKPASRISVTTGPSVSASGVTGLSAIEANTTRQTIIPTPAATIEEAKEESTPAVTVRRAISISKPASRVSINANPHAVTPVTRQPESPTANRQSVIGSSSVPEESTNEPVMASTVTVKRAVSISKPASRVSIPASPQPSPQPVLQEHVEKLPQSSESPPTSLKRTPSLSKPASRITTQNSAAVPVSTVTSPTITRAIPRLAPARPQSASLTDESQSPSTAVERNMSQSRPLSRTSASFSSTAYKGPSLEPTAESESNPQPVVDSTTTAPVAPIESNISTPPSPSYNADSQKVASEPPAVAGAKLSRRVSIVQQRRDFFETTIQKQRPLSPAGEEKASPTGTIKRNFSLISNRFKADSRDTNGDSYKR